MANVTNVTDVTNAQKQVEVTVYHRFNCQIHTCKCANVTGGSYDFFGTGCVLARQVYSKIYV